MAPSKHANTTNKNAGNSVPNTTSSSSITNATNSGNSSTSSSSQRKQTGTVPKSSTKSTATNVGGKATTENQLNGQKPILQPPGVAQMANRCSPLNIVASIQQQQQQQHMRSQQQYKNTEIVAPIRRELKDLNVCIL